MIWHLLASTTGNRVVCQSRTWLFHRFLQDRPDSAWRSMRHADRGADTRTKRRAHFTDLKNIAFALFIFALGFTGGPQFFANVGRGWRYGILSIIEMLSYRARAWSVVAVLQARSGTAAGLLAGAATESAVVGTASEAIGRLGVCRCRDRPPAGEHRHRLQRELPVRARHDRAIHQPVRAAHLRVNLRDEAERLWRKLGGDGALGEGQSLAAPPLVGRE